MDGRGLWTRGWSSSGGKETEDWNQLSLIMCYLISADVYLTLVYCVFVVIYLGSRNGDWTLICTPRKMIINTECTGEIFILWKKQVRNEWKSHLHFTILMTPLSCLSDQLMALISAAKEHCVEFIYAISPGLDITFSNPKEVAALKRKLSQVCVWHQSDWGEETLSLWFYLRHMCVFRGQVSEFGCRSFALLFDDIEAEMCGADKEAFSSFADAQVSITNEVFQHLEEPQIFLFCPTGMLTHSSIYWY